VIDALGMVDVDDEPVGIRELDGQHLDARQVVLDPGRDLVRQLLFSLVGLRQLVPLTKNGPRGPISPYR
jgi:hypothetical protein